MVGEPLALILVERRYSVNRDLPPTNVVDTTHTQTSRRTHHVQWHR